jgi:hypothetical protein
MEQNYGFDQWRNDHEMIRNRTAKVNMTINSLCLSASYFSARSVENGKIVLFGRPHINTFPKLSSKKWTSASCRNESRVNCLASFSLLEQMNQNGASKKLRR